MLDLVMGRDGIIYVLRNQHLKAKWKRMQDNSACDLEGGLDCNGFHLVQKEMPYYLENQGNKRRVLRG